MLGVITTLTACVLLCGAIAFLNWFFCQIGAPNPWRRIESGSESAQAALAQSQLLIRPALSFYRRLLTLVLGALFAGFWFVGTLHARLSPPERPIVPEAWLGYTHFFNTKHGGVYGTYFEYVAVSYGIWVTGGGMLLAILIAIKLKINLYDGSPAFPLLIFVASATSMVLCFALWQGSLYFARL